MPTPAQPIASVTLFGISGPGKAVNTTLKPGASATVGRTERAGIVVGDDSFLSGLHFGVFCGPDAVIVRDLGSRNGIFVHQQPVRECVLTNGDRITAGSGEYGVRIDTSQELRQVGILSSLGEPLYAVLDAARDPAILELLRGGTARYMSLYHGQAAVELASVAPYLVYLPPQSELLPQLIAAGWSNAWGIFLTTPLSMDDIWRQLRRSLMVTVNGVQHYFRFYDPRVLRAFLPVADQQQRTELSGDIGSFLMESEDAKSLLRFRFSGHHAGWEQIPVAAAETAETMAAQRALPSVDAGAGQTRAFPGPHAAV